MNEWSWFLFFALLTTHLIADFPLQGDFLANLKGQNRYLMFVHCMIWTGLMSFVLLMVGKFAIWKFIYLFVGHFFSDTIKAKKVDKTKALTTDLYWDQLNHLIQILLVMMLQ